MSGLKYHFRPAVRVNTPLIIGIAGPTKSGKTYSALRLATGMANGRPIAMINAEGPRGHQYAETFKYIACELSAPYRPDNYIEALQAAKEMNPGAVIIDSVSHCHDGPGGIIEWHEEILDKMAGKDFDKRNKCNFAAWIQPKAAENKLIYTMLEMPCPLILCMRAKEKLKILPGKPPIDLGWQPIVGERVAFETIFTLMLTPHSKGVPDLELCEMREPFEQMIVKGQPIDERLGAKLAAWAAGSEGAASHAHGASESSDQSGTHAPPPSDDAPSNQDTTDEPWKAKLRTAPDSRSVNEVWQRIPETLKQDCYRTYGDRLKQLKGK